MTFAGGTPENLLDFVSTLQEELVRAGVLPEGYDFEAHRELVGMQPGDVPVTYADTTALERDYGFTPTIGIREGLRAFAEWYRGVLRLRERQPNATPSRILSQTSLSSVRIRN